MATSIIALDSQYLDSLKLRLIDATIKLPFALSNLVKRVRIQMDIESRRNVDPLLAKLTRDEYIKLQIELVTYFNQFYESLNMMEEDYRSRAYR